MWLSQNCDFISHNCDLISHNCDFISHNVFPQMWLKFLTTATLFHIIEIITIDCDFITFYHNFYIYFHNSYFIIATLFHIIVFVTLIFTMFNEFLTMNFLNFCFSSHNLDFFFLSCNWDFIFQNVTIGTATSFLICKFFQMYFLNFL